MNAILPSTDSHESYIAPGPPVRALNIVLLGLRGDSLVTSEGIYLRNLSAALARLGHKIEVVCGPPCPMVTTPVKLTRLTDSLAGFSFNVAEHPGATGWRAALLRKLSHLTVMGRAAVLLVQLGKREHPPDIIHLCHGGVFFALVLQKLLLQTGRLPVVLSIHSSPVDKWIARLDWAPPWLARHLTPDSAFFAPQRWVIRQLNGLMTVSEHARQELVRQTGRPAPLLHAACVGVDTDLFCPRPELAVVPGRLITVVDSPAAAAELPTLLQALARLRATHPRAHLVVIQRMIHRPSTAELSTDVDAQVLPGVVYKRAVCDEQLAGEYARAQVAISLAAAEWFSLSALEAMSCAIAVVGADGGGTRELLAGAGFSFPPGNTAVLEHALNRLLTDPDLRRQVQHKARLRVTERLAWPKVAYGLTLFYQQHLLRAPGGRPVTR